MADTHLVPGMPGTASASPSARAAPTWHRVVTAWRALDPRRRYLVAVAAVTAVAASLGTTRTAPAASAAAVGLVGLLAGAAAVVDLHEQRLPNRLVALCAAAVLVAAALDGGRTVVDIVISLLMAALPLWIVRFGKGLAFGDVKFAAVLGAAAGLIHPFAGLVVVWFAALAAGAFALRTGRHRLALGPWLWAGYLAAGFTAVALVQLVLDPGGHTWPARP